MKPRWEELLGMVLIGDGVLNLIQPNCGPKFYKKAAQNLQAHPMAARGLGIAFVALGVWLSRRAAKA